MTTVLNCKAYDLLKEDISATFGKKIKKIPVQIKSALLQMKNLKELLGTKQYFLHRLLEIRKTHFLSLLYFDADIPLCFVGHNDDHKSEAHVSGPRIVGGQNATPVELPFQVRHTNDKVLLH